MQLVYFSSSEPAPKNAQNRFMHSQKHQGIPLITPLSLRRGVGGEAASGVFQAVFIPLLPSERDGERLYRVCFRLLFFGRSGKKACISHHSLRP